MNLTSSHPFWSVNNGLPSNYPSLQREVTCDAVVIGGGITGALGAVHQRAGLEVCDRTEMKRLEQTRRGVRVRTKMIS